MFRKNFRRRLIFGLAFAALAAPAAAQASTGYFVDGGAPPVSTVNTAVPIVRSEHSQTLITPAQADALRWQAMADAYQQRQIGVAMSERSFGVPGPDPSLVPQVVATSTSSGFDWSDAGIGASSGLVAALLLGLGIVLIRRNQHSGLTSA